LIRLLLLCFAALAALAAPAAAEYPDKPVRLLVPFIAGSTPDTAARRIAQRLTSDLNQQFVVENRGGAAGNIGAEVAARAPADGYTLMLIANSHTINPALYSHLSYDIIKDFAPICVVQRGMNLMVVPPSSPARTAMEFVEMARRQPGKLNYASGGNGSPAHLSAEAFRLATGIDYLHVPYKGAPEIVRALLGGQVDVGFPTFDAAYGQARQGLLRPLAVTGAKRARVLPDVPTMLEALPKGFVIEGWLGLAAPAGTPREVIDRISTTMKRALEDESFRSQLEGNGNEAVYMSPAELAALLPTDITMWAELVKQIGAKLD
jgi:tripartite-type tricarboxylate transporter receptor subunit TctC